MFGVYGGCCCVLLCGGGGPEHPLCVGPSLCEALVPGRRRYLLKESVIRSCPGTPHSRHSYLLVHPPQAAQAATGFTNNQTFHLFISCLLPKEFETRERLPPLPHRCLAGEGVFALSMAMWEMRGLYLANICVSISELSTGPDIPLWPCRGTPLTPVPQSKSAHPGGHRPGSETEVVVFSAHLGPGCMGG